MSMTLRRPSVYDRVILIAATFAIGCGKELPPAPTVYPVVGSVTTTSGQRLSRGAVELQSVATTQDMAFGKIEPDGTFAMKTILRDGRNIEGAVPGEYQVMVHGHSLESGSSPSETLPQTYRVEAGANQFDLIVKDAKW